MSIRKQVFINNMFCCTVVPRRVENIHLVIPVLQLVFLRNCGADSVSVESSHHLCSYRHTDHIGSRSDVTRFKISDVAV